MSRLNDEDHETAVLAATWAPVPTRLHANEFALRMKEIMTDICNGAMPRVSVIGGNHQPLY